MVAKQPQYIDPIVAKSVSKGTRSGRPILMPGLDREPKEVPTVGLVHHMLGLGLPSQDSRNTIEDSVSWLKHFVNATAIHPITGKPLKHKDLCNTPDAFLWEVAKHVEFVSIDHYYATNFTQRFTKRSHSIVL